MKRGGKLFGDVDNYVPARRVPLPCCTGSQRNLSRSEQSNSRPRHTKHINKPPLQYPSNPQPLQNSLHDKQHWHSLYYTTYPHQCDFPPSRSGVQAAFGKYTYHPPAKWKLLNAAMIPAATQLSSKKKRKKNYIKRNGEV